MAYEKGGRGKAAEKSYCYSSCNISICDSCDVATYAKVKQFILLKRLNELYAETLADYDKLKIIMDDQHHSNSRQMEELQKRLTG